MRCIVLLLMYMILLLSLVQILSSVLAEKFSLEIFEKLFFLTSCKKKSKKNFFTIFDGCISCFSG